MKRRVFIMQLGSLFALSACGKSKETIEELLDKPVKFRFSVASDWHYGEPGTDYLDSFKNFSDGFKAFSQSAPSDFFVMNGDIIHNDPALLNPAAALLKPIHPNLLVTQGNHDRVAEDTWKSVWGMPFNHDVVIKDQVILLGGTSNIIGAELCPDTSWFEAKLNQYKSAKNIFIFIHIHPYDRLGCTDFLTLLSKYNNVKAVFNGHDHNDESIKTIGKIPFMFDGRIGGSWGSFDRMFRVVEIKEDNSMITYLMTPGQKKKQTSF